MKMSTKGRYGLRAMIDLALNSVNEHVSLKNIAKRQSISENYLEQVFSVLRKAGLVKSIKGAQGGYFLTSKPSNLKIGDILRVLEGDLRVVDSQDNNNTVKECIKINVWDKMNENIRALLDSLTLEDMVNEYKKMNDTYSFIYHI